MSDPSNTSTSKESSARGAPPFEHRYTTDADPQIHYVHVPSTTSSSDGPNSPVMLVHGFPQSWRAWGPVAGLLADEHSLLIPDLRGFGDSARPLTGYGTTVGGGEDLMAVLDHSGIERVTLVGHDLGAVVAYFFAVNHPERVDRLVFVEAALPTSDQSTWPTLWHWPFLNRPDLAEAIITGDEYTFLRALFNDYAKRPATLDEGIDHYARHLTAPGGLRSALAWFREGVHNDEVWLRAHSPTKLEMPVLALGGGLWGDRPLHMLQEVADDVRGGTVPGVGHWIPEEDPEALVAWLRTFINDTPLAEAT